LTAPKGSQRPLVFVNRLSKRLSKSGLKMGL